MNPTEQFREGVLATIRIALNGSERGKDWPVAGDTEALASIQASALQFFTALIGEDEPHDPLCLNYGGNCNCDSPARNALRQELRQKIDQLIKDLSK